VGSGACWRPHLTGLLAAPQRCRCRPQQASSHAQEGGGPATALHSGFRRSHDSGRGHKVCEFDQLAAGGCGHDSGAALAVVGLEAFLETSWDNASMRGSTAGVVGVSDGATRGVPHSVCAWLQQLVGQGWLRGVR
jgi:hypothetical protein